MALHPLVAGLRATRISSGITIADMSRRSGVSETTIRNTENGMFTPRLKVIDGMCRALGLELIMREVKR